MNELEIDLRPEAPAGYRVLECWAEPKHPGLYMVEDDPDADGYYHPPGFYCTASESHKHQAELEHKQHSRFLRTRLGGWLVSRAYTLGIISGSVWRGGGPGGCNGCRSVYWRGKRPYILGWYRENWRCLLRYHHWPTDDKILGGMCTKCLPCDVCGSTAAWHRCEAY